MTHAVSGIRVKRAHELPAEDDGQRVLVDRVWPRGLSKDKLQLDDRLPEIAPSPELRRWFAHDPKKWPEFQKRYWQELDENPEPVEKLLAIARETRLTLVFAAKDTEHNNAQALKAYLERRL